MPQLKPKNKSLSFEQNDSPKRFIGPLLPLKANKIIIALTILGVLGCANKGPGAKAVAEEYGEPYQGMRAGPPELKDQSKRLDIFLGVPVGDNEALSLDPSPRWKQVIYCVARNEEKKPLPEVHELISKTPPDKLIYIYGVRITKKHGFWWDGVDCEAEAIAVWHPQAQRYIIFDLTYGTPIWKVLSIRKALRRAIESGAKAAVKGVAP